MNKPTQRERVEKRILEQGYITRNQCLSTFPAITRLGAIICDMQKTGWEFTTDNKNGDYKYVLVRTLYKTVTRTLANGQVITQTIKKYG